MTENGQPVDTWETDRGDTVEVYYGNDGDWHYRVQAANGEIVDYGEGYTRRANATSGALRYHPPANGSER